MRTTPRRLVVRSLRESPLTQISERIDMPNPSRAFIAGVTVALLSACGGAGGSEESADTVSGPSPSAASSSPTEDTTEESTMDADMQLIDVESESKNVGFDVADYAIKNDFTNPANQADFEKLVDYTKSLRPGSEAGFEPVGDSFRICVTHVADDQLQAWAIYDATSGLAEGAVGAPTDQLCP